MSKSLDTLVEDVYRVLDERNHHEVDEANVEAAGEQLKALLREHFKTREPRRGEEVLRFSAIGKKDRQIWYAANRKKEPEVLPPKTMFKFLYGHVLELLMLFLAKEAGHEVTHEQFEVESNGVKGHMDAVIDGVVVDCKSASSYSFAKFKSGEFLFDDPFGYIPQISGYANELDKTEEQRSDGRSYSERAAFFVSDKVHGDLTIAEVDGATIKGNPPGPRIDRLRDVIRADEPPPRCYSAIPEGKSGNMKLGVGCSYCPDKYECWEDANGGRGLRMFLYSKGPVWLTEVVKEPNVEEFKVPK